MTVPLGSSAKLMVAAVGSGSLSYQWSANGSAIPGANSSSYEVNNVTLGDSGESFTVAVSNRVNSVTSTPASITVGPRSPQAGDLRFQQVDAPSQADQGTGSSSWIEFMDGSSNGQTNSTISPLHLGNGSCVAGVAHDCSWGVLFQSLPTGQTGIDAYCDGGFYSSFASDLAAAGSVSGMSSSNSVITSFDLRPGNDAYAATWLSTTQTAGFTLKREVVDSGAVSATVAADAAKSRVVTAVSFDSSTDQVDLLSYGWQGDTTTVYDTDVLMVGPSIPDIESAAATLAQQGYIITAFGGNFSDGFVLVGTKVHGDTLPRPVLIFDQNSAAPTFGELDGYANVAVAEYYPNPGATQYVFVYEK